MTIPFDCPHCGDHTDVAEEYAGQTGPCARCGKTVTVPPLSGTPGYTTPTKGSPVLLVVLLIVAVLGLLLFFCGGAFFWAFRMVPAPMPPVALSPTPIGPPATPLPATTTAQVTFVGPEGMRVDWQISGQEWSGGAVLTLPGGGDFQQKTAYDIELTNIPGYPDVRLAGKLEIGPSESGAEFFLASSAVPIEFTDEDFDEVLAGNPLTKVYYLPNEESGGSAASSADVAVSTRLDPDVDPLVEAGPRGIVLLVVRLGDKKAEIAAEPD